MTRLMRMAALAVVLVAGFGLAACEQYNKMMMEDEASLYDRMGGEAKMRPIVAQFVANMNTDENLSSYFADADMDKLRAGMTAQFCQATGGPCESKDAEMAAAHAGMDLSDAEFDMTREHLRRALVVFRVGEAEQAEFLDVYNSMKGEVAG